MRCFLGISVLWLGCIAIASPTPFSKSNNTLGEAFEQPLRKRALANGAPLRILALGASTMNGYGSSDGNGFRYGLRNQLVAGGSPVNFIGSLSTGTMSDNQNEGWSGFRIDEVAEKAKLNYASKPNIVLISVGLNDLGQNWDVPNAHNRQANLWEALFAAIPDVTIITSGLFPNVDPALDAKIIEYNGKIYNEVVKRQNQGKKITFVDFHSSWFSLQDMKEGSHPSDAGYLKMAATFMRGIEAADQAGWIKAPAVVSGIPDNDSGTTGNNCWKRPGQALGPYKTQGGSGYDDGKYVHSSTKIADLAGFNNTPPVLFNNRVPEGVYWADINGDGIDDYVYVAAASSLGIGVALSLGAGNLGPYSWFAFAPDCVREGVKFADMTGDGRDDFCCVSEDGALTCWQNTPGSDARWPNWVGMGVVKTSEGHKRAAIRLADIDGDGRADYVAINANGKIHGWRNGATANLKPAYWTAMGGVFTGTPRTPMSGWRFADLNGDHRDDLLYTNANGYTETWINQRGYGVSLTPFWQSVGNTHGGGDSPRYVVFGKYMGSGRADYSSVTVDPQTENVAILRHRNDGKGGAQVKGDGTRFCDMTGSGADDYIWIHPNGEVLLYGNQNQWGDKLYWKWYDSIFNANRIRKEVHFADFTGDGKCDILLVDKSNGATRVFRNDFADDKFAFTDIGIVNSGAVCTEGYGHQAHDLGVQWYDMDGDGRADMLCITRHGLISGWLNKGVSNMQRLAQIKKDENWERRHIRFADVDGDGKTDILSVHPVTGQTKGWKNLGYTATPVSGSSFVWNWPNGETADPTIASGMTTRGDNIEFANLGGLGRADYIMINPQANTAYTHFNVCPGSGGAGPSTPNLPDAPAFPGGGAVFTDIPREPKLELKTSCAQLEAYQLEQFNNGGSDHFETEFYEELTGSVYLQAFYEKFTSSDQTFYQKFAANWGVLETSRCELESGCASVNCNHLGDKKNAPESAVAYAVMLSMANMGQTFQAIWKSIDTAQKFFVNRVENYTLILNPSHPANILDITQILYGFAGIVSTAMAFAGPAGGASTAFVSAGATLINNAIGIGAGNNARDPIQTLADMKAPVARFFEKAHTDLASMLGDVVGTGVNKGTTVVEMFRKGVYSESTEIPALNSRLLSEVNRVAFFQKMMEAMTINVAWKQQRVWIMSYPMDQETFLNTPVRVSPDSSPQRWWDGRGYFTQSVYADFIGPGQISPKYQDPPGWKQFTIEGRRYPEGANNGAQISMGDIMYGSIQTQAAGGFNNTEYPNIYDWLKPNGQTPSSSSINTFISTWSIHSRVFNLPICDLGDSDMTISEFFDSLSKAGERYSPETGISSFCYCLEKQDQFGVKFKDVIDFRDWARGPSGWCDAL